MLYRFEATTVGLSWQRYQLTLPLELLPATHKGKYVSDGTWSATAVSHSAAPAVLLRRMVERGLAQLPDQPAPKPNADPLVVPYSTSKPRDEKTLTRAFELQRWLNTLLAFFLKVDGICGDKTSEAYRQPPAAICPATLAPEQNRPHGRRGSPDPISSARPWRRCSRE